MEAMPKLLFTLAFAFFLATSQVFHPDNASTKSIFEGAAKSRSGFVVVSR